MSSGANSSASGSLRNAALSCWALLLGMGVVMTGNGLQGPLLAMRATMEDFGVTQTGFVMAGYFVGFTLGSFLAPRLVANVGHVRVFAALASLASVSILLHGYLIDVSVWFALRVLTGFAFAGIYVVAESWLNDVVTNETRGRLLGLYMIITMAGFGLGPLMLNMAEISELTLFVAISVLVSVALVPILLTAGKTPEFATPEKLKLRSLWLASPLGVFSCLISAVPQGALVSLGAVFADDVGLSLAETTQFVAVSVLGAVFLQWPIGWLSDRFDRRLILTLVSTLCGLLALGGWLFGQVGNAGFWLTFAVFYGGLSYTMYSLNIAHVNDRISQKQMVAASAAIVLFNGVGGIFGPVLAGFALNSFGTDGFLWTLAGAHLAVTGFALYRMTQGEPVALDDQTPALYVTRPSAVGVAAAMEHAYEVAEEEGEETRA